MANVVKSWHSYQVFCVFIQLIFPPMHHSSPQPFLPQALVLCAGRGERMRPLSDHTPKPLLSVNGKPLITWHLEHLAHAGMRQVLINTAWLGSQIPEHLASHAPANLQLGYSREDLDFGGALETAGGIVRSLPRLADPFWVMAGDVYMPDFNFSTDLFTAFQRSSHLAHVWLVPNPAHHPKGDFGISSDGLALCADDDPMSECSHQERLTKFTFSTVALYKKEFFTQAWCDIPLGNPLGIKAPVAPMLKEAMRQGRVSASLYNGLWCDVGTPERLAELNAQVAGLK